MYYYCCVRVVRASVPPLGGASADYNSQKAFAASVGDESSLPGKGRGVCLDQVLSNHRGMWRIALPEVSGSRPGG